MTALPTLNLSARGIATAAAVVTLTLSASWFVASRSVPAAAIDETYGNTQIDSRPVAAAPRRPVIENAAPARTPRIAQAEMMPLDQIARIVFFLVMASGVLVARGWLKRSR